MNILFRVDCNKKNGSGHFSRCYTLSEELKKKNHKVFFLSINFDKKYFYKKKILNLINIKKSKKIDESKDFKITSDIIKKKKIDTVILDNYLLKKNWCNYIRKKIKNFVIIDDNFKKNYKCDLYIDYTIVNFTKKKLHKLLGLKYFFLNKEYIKLKNGNFLKSYDVFINFGTGNFTREVKNLLNILNKIHVIKKVVLAGKYEKDLKFFKKNVKFKIILINKFEHLGEYIKKSKICIGAGGVNVVERMIINNKNIVFSCAEHQTDLCRSLNKKNAVNFLGRINILNNKKLRNRIQKVIVKIIKTKNRKFSTIVDGKGTIRVAKRIQELSQINEKI